MKLFALLLLAASATAMKDYSNMRVLRVTPLDGQQMKMLQQLGGLVFAEDAHPGRPSEILVPVERFDSAFRAIQALGIPITMVKKDVQRIVDSSLDQLCGSQDFDFTCWNTFSEYLAFAAEIADRTDIASSMEDIGESVEGAPLRVLKYNPGGATEKIWIDGGIHAREWISPQTVAYLVDQLVNNYEANKELADKYDWHILIVQNPDGFQYTVSDDRFWRKNRNENNGGGCYGVDLNRNWDFHWAETGTSTSPCSDIYHGSGPDSEPEIYHVRDYLLELNSDNSIQMFFTLHSYGRYWLSPWGWTSDYPEDYDELEEQMIAGVNAIEAEHGLEYTYGSSTNVLYAAAGASDDWAKGVLGVAASYTLELRSLWSFDIDADQIIPTGEEVWAGMQAAISTREAQQARKAQRN